jgi:hypothetical protein
MQAPETNAFMLNEILVYNNVKLPTVSKICLHEFLIVPAIAFV